jgi:ABC-type dipeptide/oligopeptide/nickel transport system permease component
MTAYIVRRLLLMLPVALLVTVIVFTLIHLTPGDPAIAYLGEEATPQAVAALRHELGLDQPLPVQYVIYLGNVLHGNLGNSIKSHEPVSQAIFERLPATFELGMAALLFALAVALPAGVISALRHGTGTGLAASIVPLVGVSLPNFFLALVLILVFGLYLRIFPPGGFISLTEDPGDNLRHLILPAISLGTVIAAINLRLMRSSLIEVLGQDYVRTARAKGLAERLVTVRHALRNALIPVVTVIGIQVGLLLEGAFVTETIFAWPGIGRLAVEGIFMRDYPIVQGVVLVAACVFMLASLLVDVLYVYLDPRISYR